MNIAVTVIAVLVAIAAPFVTTRGPEPTGGGLALRLVAAVVAATVVAYVLDWAVAGPLSWTAVSIAMAAGVAGAAVNAKHTDQPTAREQGQRSSSTS